MRLLAQEMDEFVLAAVSLVQLGGYIAQFAFCADVVEKDRHHLGELLGQIVNRGNGMVQKLGDVSLEKVCVAHAGSRQVQIDNQRRKECGAPLGFLLNQGEPDPDIGEVSRVGDGLPVLIHTAHAGVLEAKAHSFPQKGFHQPGVVALEDLAANGLDALQGGMRIALDIGFQQAEGGGEKAFNLLKGLAADQLHQGAVDLPKRFLVNERQPAGFHDAEEEEQPPVVQKLRAALAHLFFSHGCREVAVTADKVHVFRQLQHPFQGRPGRLACQFFQPGQMLADAGMGNGLQERSAGPVFSVVTAVGVKPGFRVLFSEPVFGVALQEGLVQAGQGLTVGRTGALLPELHDAAAHLAQGILTLDNGQQELRFLAVQFLHPLKKGGEDRLVAGKGVGVQVQG